jgi:acyl-CoA synthetase (AMP-forming)/AMP-acid ligase II/3-oxoacyl-(acyl-carrier-protein) synthase/acyl carrier protein
MQQQSPHTLIDLLRWRATTSPEGKAYSFFKDGVTETETHTYGTLFRRAESIATFLKQRKQRPGTPVPLIYAAGTDFIEAFLGCMLAGCIPVALPAPDELNSRRVLPRLQTIIGALDSSLVATNIPTETFANVISSVSPILSNEIVFHSALCESDSSDTKFNFTPPSGTAFLQFTSGSTGAPYGTQISHQSLLHQLSLLAAIGTYDPESVIVTWMPHFHDYGLISGLLLPLYVGAPCLTMPPSVFLRHPVRWLHLLSTYRGTHSSGPSFAYEYCGRMLTRESIATLDLSSWREAGVAAEPIKPEVLKRFASLLNGTGFRFKSFCPGYGLAEYTLAITYTRPEDDPILLDLDPAALLENVVRPAVPNSSNAVTLVGCGRSLDPAAKLVIVDPSTLTACAEDRVGEVWASGTCIADGYYKSSTDTRGIFEAFLADSGEGPFLRTGDVGFCRDGELFITGRLKDLIIVAGENHYPQDLEWTARHAHAHLSNTTAVAFSIYTDSLERVVLICEWRGEPQQMKEAFRAIRSAILEEHGITLSKIIFVRPGSVYKTSSGKLQRAKCREEFLNQRISILAEDIGEDVGIVSVQKSQRSVDTGYTVAKCTDLDVVAVRSMLRKCLHVATLLPQEMINDDKSFFDYGLTSIQLLQFIADIEQALGIRVSPVLIFENPTIQALACNLCRSEIAGTYSRSTSKRSGISGGGEPIAIIGIDCKFPGAPNPTAYWRLLSSGDHGITTMPQERLARRAFDSISIFPIGEMKNWKGGFIPCIDCFDRTLFSVSRQEAVHMDPQQRILLETTWTALENACLDIGNLAGSSVGVYVGASQADYNNLLQRNPVHVSAFAGTGGALSVTASRISYAFDFRGPSMTIDTACSSSLVAVHLACESLRNMESDLAIAAGVNLLLSPETTVILAHGGLLAPDGRCKTFDSRANGYVRSEGCGVVILKRLADALRERDRIEAIVLGSAVNQNGRSIGMTTPNPAEQRNLIEKALANSGISPSDIGYIEAHGTGTAIGDALEFAALTDLMTRRDQIGDQGKGQCFVGSSKPNIGHLEAAAGIAGLIKAILMLRHRTIPPHPGMTERNPRIHLDHSRLRITTDPLAWPITTPTVVGISSFGFGGTNAHVIVREAPEIEVAEGSDNWPWHLLTMSARSQEALQDLATHYSRFLEDENNASFADICFTANTTRSHHEHRLAVVAQTRVDARASLADFLSGRSSARVKSGIALEQSLKLQMHFSGSEFPLSLAVVACAPTIEATFNRIRAMLGISHNAPRDIGFAAEYSLGLWLQSCGIGAHRFTGTAVGKYVAACMAAAASVHTYTHAGALPAEYSEPLRMSEDCSYSLLVKADDDWRQVLEIIAEIYVLGARLRWDRIYRKECGTRVPLPTYPFQHESYWISDTTK